MFRIIFKILLIVLLFSQSLSAQDVYKIEIGGEFCGYIEALTLESDLQIQMMMKSYFVNTEEKKPEVFKQEEVHVFTKELEPLTLQIVQKSSKQEIRTVCTRSNDKIVLVLEESGKNTSERLFAFTGQKLWPNMFVIGEFLKRTTLEEETFPLFDMLNPQHHFQLQVKKLGNKSLSTDIGEIACSHYRLEFRLGEQVRVQTLLLRTSDFRLVQFVDFGPTPKQSTRVQMTSESIKASAQELFKQLRTRNQPKNINWLIDRLFTYEIFSQNQLLGTSTFLLKKNTGTPSGFILESHLKLHRGQSLLSAQGKTTYTHDLQPLTYEVQSQSESLDSEKKPVSRRLETFCTFSPTQISIDQVSRDPRDFQDPKTPINFEDLIDTKKSRTVACLPETYLIDRHIMGHFALLCTRLELEEGYLSRFTLFHPGEQTPFNATLQVLDEVQEESQEKIYYVCDFHSKATGRMRLWVSSKNELLELRHFAPQGQWTFKLKELP
jgi:hypothetical protein